MLGFFLRKFVASLLYPPTLCLLIALFGWILLLHGRFAKTAKALIGFGLIGLLLLSIPALQQPIIRALEASPEPREKENLAAIVVLGAGVYQWDSEVPSTHQLGATSLSRAAEGIRLAKKHPTTPLIFTGGTIGERPPSSISMANLALDMGIPSEQIITFDSPTSTAEEATRTASEIGSGKILLVSSALHLPRASLLFAQAGLDPINAPTDFLADDSPPDLMDFFPSASAWLNWQRAFHELYGQVWMKITDR